jgi:hypothetical protein
MWAAHRLAGWPSIYFLEARKEPYDAVAACLECWPVTMRIRAMHHPAGTGHCTAGISTLGVNTNRAAGHAVTALNQERRGPSEVCSTCVLDGVRNVVQPIFSLHTLGRTTA